jgi:membrane-anchored glycerophosphoryl diester phosphodiesterase (GDPDase)
MFVGLAGFVAALLYVSARFSLAIPACVLERLGPVDAIRRSLALTQGSALRLALVIILTATVYYLLSAIFSIPYVFAMIRMFSSKNFAGLTPYLMFQYVGEFIASSFASPLAAIAATLMYYDERIRKEAFDLQWMMVLMGGQSQPPAEPQPPAQEPPQPEGLAATPPALG